MDILIQSTKEFEQDLEAFSKPEQSNIIEKMNQDFQILLNDKNSLFEQKNLAQMQTIKLTNDYDSSLYSLRINPKIRVILTIDDDPIFDRIIITLFRVVKSSEASEAYNSVVKYIYKDLILLSKS